MPTHVNGTFGAGLLCTQGKSIAQTQFFGDGEGGHVTQFGVAIHLGAGTGQHTSQVFHIFHGTHQVAKVIFIGFEAS